MFNSVEFAKKHHNWIESFQCRCLEQLSPNASEQRILSAVLLGNFGLLIIDHIHFQYNGILFGILLLSISYMCEEKFLKSAFFFAVLLNMKHIFVYVSPVYIVYLLKVYCWNSSSVQSAIWNLIKLGAITVGVTAISFGPFVRQFPQVGWFLTKRHFILNSDTISSRSLIFEYFRLGISSSISIQTWAMSCILGAKLLGYL